MGIQHRVWGARKNHVSWTATSLRILCIGRTNILAPGREIRWGGVTYESFKRDPTPCCSAQHYFLFASPPPNTVLIERTAWHRFLPTTGKCRNTFQASAEQVNGRSFCFRSFVCFHRKRVLCQIPVCVVLVWLYGGETMTGPHLRAIHINRRPTSSGVHEVT